MRGKRLAGILSGGPTVNPDRVLYWDCETRSPVDLRATGVYVYARHPRTDVTVARLALGREAPGEWRPGQRLADRYAEALADPAYTIVAHNAAFERVILEEILRPRYGWPFVPIWRWVCTMARARAQALPASLDQAAAAAGLDVRKDATGHGLMMRMCRPRSTATDGTITWWEDEARMARLSDYCATDVVVERALHAATAPLPEHEHAIWAQTEMMNDRGVRFDLSFVGAARVVAEDTRVLLDAEIRQLTDGAVKRASAVTDLKRWLASRGVDLSPPPDPGQPVSVVLDAGFETDAGTEVEDWAGEEDLPELRRRDVLRLIADERVSIHEKRVLQVRLEAGKISTRKLDAIRNRADDEGRVRGLIGYHGASTGRDISTGLQVQNFPRDTVPDWEGMRELLDHGAALVDAVGGPPLDIISRMLRGAIIPADGHEIAAGDFSSVEAVGVAWLAGQTDLLESFRRKEKVYEQMGALIYGVPVDSVEPDSKARFIGKTIILGCGYQMGWWKFRETALVQTGILLTPDEAERAVRTYRETFERIPALWRGLNDAAMIAVRHPGSVTSAAGDRVRFMQHGHWLRMRLPSGRYLWYSRPLIGPGKYGDVVTYMSVNAKTRKWERTSTYGGRLAENCVQGLCRDLLVEATLRLEEAGYRPLTRVHDEVIAEPPIGHGSIEEMCEMMSELPDWATGFALSAKGRRGRRYQK